MSEKEEMTSEGGLNVTLTLRLLMHGKVFKLHWNNRASFVVLKPNEWSNNTVLKWSQPANVTSSKKKNVCVAICSGIVIFLFTGSRQHNWQGRFLAQSAFIDSY